MKIIGIHSKENKLIKLALRKDRIAQKKLFDQFAPKMLGVCRSYVKDVHHAEDLMISGFLKVFTQLDSYKNQGSFEGWIRTIMIRTCISYLRKKNQIDYSDNTEVTDLQIVHNLENSGEKELQSLIDALPAGYKMVFNLFVIEGYSHAEIAKQLNITESTSKSQLFKARKMLQTNYNERNEFFIWRSIKQPQQ